MSEKGSHGERQPYGSSYSGRYNNSPRTNSHYYSQGRGGYYKSHNGGYHKQGGYNNGASRYEQTGGSKYYRPHYGIPAASPSSASSSRYGSNNSVKHSYNKVEKPYYHYHEETKKEENSSSAMDQRKSPFVYMMGLDKYGADMNEIDKIFEEENKINMELEHLKFTILTNEIEDSILNSMVERNVLNVQLTQEKLDSLLLNE
ncbi:hypothetical protein KAFR_0A01150 [Kazachstania africana CBS 2517]|uniref:Transcription regulator LGE1 helical region domain-containing protein n=1 Tax=Kazachstania africana (strain ATCC 22294 / BCRC 22015 / CBS 2517 / CECT 1963 / NBRC 1671 / NRRL Y-8276) TaxID=1071382 RepID=H2AMF4_KAZAF|nr:hypothetical protein KAFR_0A01150 [Kazachstania africana CBS 2517]CCF55554.1 hypothetical protein KAFR_0A01150 [Kazachstania africana CBS 2517]